MEVYSSFFGLQLHLLVGVALPITIFLASYTLHEHGHHIFPTRIVILVSGQFNVVESDKGEARGSSAL